MVDTTRHFERTIRDLETKLSRQQSAVITTLEMIEAIKALRDKERENAEQAIKTSIANARTSPETREVLSAKVKT